MLRLCVSRWRKPNLSNSFSKIITNNINTSNKISRKYSTKWSCKPPKEIRPFVTENNIFQSPFGDVDIHDNVYLHDYIWKNVDRWWNKTSLICALTGRSYTYEQLRRSSGRFATSLRKLDLRPGDTVAAVLPNIPEYVMVFLGASEAGIRLTLINPTYTAREINQQLVNAEAAAVVTVPSRYPVVAESINGSSIRHPVIVIEDGNGSAPSGTINFKDLISDSIQEFEKTGQKTEIDITNDTSLLPYSSGTTGLPKGVELTHRNLVANLVQIDHRGYGISEPASEEFQEIIPVLLPLYHIYGLSTVLYEHLSKGGKMICMPTFTSNVFLDVLDKHRMTNLFVAPPVLQLMANDGRFQKKHFESVRRVVSGAASAGEEVIAKFQSKVGDSFMFSQGYGMTEASPVITIGTYCPNGSVGKVMPSSEIRIVSTDDYGKNLGVNETGEVWVKGPQVMKGYFKNPKATLETMDGDWLKCGDLGNFDKDGNLWITGRLKELIKVKGMQVSPAELEDILHAHKKIADAAVIGVPHERYGEMPKAFVVPQKNVQVEADEIKKFIAERVVEYKRLGEVVIIDQIPKSAAGKILRNELKKL